MSVKRSVLEAQIANLSKGPPLEVWKICTIKKKHIVSQPIKMKMSVKHNVFETHIVNFLRVPLASLKIWTMQNALFLNRSR